MIRACLFRLFRLFGRKPEVLGREKILLSGPAIFTANHLGPYGPVKMMLYTVPDLVPWVNVEITRKDTCAAYLQMDFAEPVLKLRGRSAAFVSRLIAPLCIGLMNLADAIPVHHGERQIVETFRRSLEVLEEGRSLLIFPEDAGGRAVRGVKPFQSGFVRLGADYYRETGRRLLFYPVAVDKRRNRIRFGEPLEYRPEAPFAEEKRRIVQGLQEAVGGMLEEEA